ncbi:MAG: SRPBCC family protein [Deltaproteobacteria bacterium]|nr:SRPBCC family protein [Deltaproteobacteria bacterium]
MTTPQPTGRLDGNDLILTRTFRAPIDDVWTSITHPDSTARWFGRWEGPSGAGSKIRIQLGFEQGMPWSDATIERCDRPHHLGLTTVDASGTWHMEITLAESGGTTTLTFVHHLKDRSGVGEIGPGWEYYLDQLVASREGAPLPTFDMYYPAQKAYFVALP